MNILLAMLCLAAADQTAQLVQDLETFKPGVQALRPDVLALVKIGLPAVQPLIGALKGPGGAPAALALGKIGDKAAVPALVDCLAGGSTDDSVAACGVALVQIADTSALPKLCELLKKGKGKPLHLYNAASVVGQLKDTSCVEPLKKLTKSGNQYVRASAAQALGRIGDASASKEVFALCKDKNEQVAALSMIAAGQLKVAEVKPLLLAAYETNQFESAGVGLGFLGELDVLYAGLQDKSWQKRQAAISGLAVSSDPKAFDTVVAYLQSEKLSGDELRCAAQSFMRAHNKNAIPALTAARDAFKAKGKSYASVVDIADTYIAKINEGASE